MMAPMSDAKMGSEALLPLPDGTRGKPPRRFRKRMGVLASALLLFLSVCFAFLQQRIRWMVFSPGAVLSEAAQDPNPLDFPYEQFVGDDGYYLLGVGKGDITGPVVEVHLMGYASSEQIGTGLRQRLYSRAFIVGSLENPHDRIIYVVSDIHSGDTAVRYGILSGLQKLGPEYSVYGHDSLAFTGTHSHSGPGGWLNYLLPQLSTKGFDQQSYRAIVDGTLLAIQRAHESLEPGTLSVAKSKLSGVSINRSLFSYLANPEAERTRYNISAEDDGSTDNEMTMLRFRRASDGKNTGLLTWFPTHGTSMLGNNTLVSGDNKGVAANLLEKEMRGDDSAAEGFVAGFSQANMGDISPNVLGAYCEDGSGDMCHFRTSTCSNGLANQCQARGPFFREQDNGAASCFEIGRRQFEGALGIYRSTEDSFQRLRGPVKGVHIFYDMSNLELTLPDGREVKTCSAALGYSFPAGTSDGAGPYDFIQHLSNGSNTSPIWRVVPEILRRPGREQEICQHPKPILLNLGGFQVPYEWMPSIVDVQTLRIGPMVIIVSPSEATTMAGRRWKDAVSKRAGELWEDELKGQEPVVVLGGPGNTYAHYVTTEEEYQIQRFEGAATIFGQHTLAAYMNRSLGLLPKLASGARQKADQGRELLAPDHSSYSFSLITGVIRDGAPWSKNFGDVKLDVVASTFRRGQTASALFVAANPRNNLRLEQTYAAVEYRRRGETKWETVRDDSDWQLLFEWRRTSELLGTSEVEVTWEVEDWAEPGEYRLVYYGDAKSVSGRLTPFKGKSSVFEVIE